MEGTDEELKAKIRRMEAYTYYLDRPDLVAQVTAMQTELVRRSAPPPNQGLKQPLTAFITPFSKAPSSTKEEDVKKHKDFRLFYFSCNANFVEAICAYYDCRAINIVDSVSVRLFFEHYVSCFKAADKTVMPPSYMSQHRMDELGKSALLTPHLPIPSTINEQWRFFWAHQSFVLVNNEKAVKGKVDMALYISFPSSMNNGVCEHYSVPLVICEMSLNDDFGGKRCQLFNTANSIMVNQMTRELEWPLLGIIFNGSLFEVHCYFISRDSNYVSDIVLLEDQKTTEENNWLALFTMIQKWCDLFASLVVKCVVRSEDAYSPVYISGSRVCESSAGDYVYKTYDYRHSNIERRFRSPEYYFEFMPSTEYMLNDEYIKLKIIKYRKLEGNHVAILPIEFVNILSQLLFMHNKSVVHGDIRLYNMVFNHEKPECSALIDFDYCGVAGMDTYPLGIVEVPDGKRTASMLSGGKMSIEDDCTCMAFCMSLFSPGDKDHIQTWKDCCELVNNCDLERALIKLAKCNFTLTVPESETYSICELSDGGTGSPDEKVILQNKRKFHVK